MRFAITDASPLIGLALVEGLVWLPQLFGEVLVTASVKREGLPSQEVKGKEQIAYAFGTGWLSCYSEPIDEPHNTSSLDELDQGERDSIALGLMHPLSSVILLIDERLGRSVAQENGLSIVGTAGLIGVAKKRGLISAAKPVFAMLHASDFRISREVIRTVLASVGED